jgi:hypothetical protein
MMDCLLCIKVIYVAGSLGAQNPAPETNDYGQIIGTVDIVAESNNGLFARIRHTSGVNTAEPDYGMNSIEIGGKIFLWESKR